MILLYASRQSWGAKSDVVLYCSFQNIWSQDMFELLNVLEELRIFVYVYIYYLLFIVLEIIIEIFKIYVLIYSIIQ